MGFHISSSSSMFVKFKTVFFNHFKVVEPEIKLVVILVILLCTLTHGNIPCNLDVSLLW